jgi:hypothetical protein
MNRPAVKDAWDQFQTIAGLTNTRLDKSYRWKFHPRILKYSYHGNQVCWNGCNNNILLRDIF